MSKSDNKPDAEDELDLNPSWVAALDTAAEPLWSDAELDAIDRTTIGRPRMAWGSDAVFVRLSPAPDVTTYAARRGGERAMGYTAFDTVKALSEPLTLRGPASSHAIDELAARVFERAPNFAVPLQTLRRSAQSMLRRGARYLQFKPLLIESPPGIGKTSWAMRLADASGLPALYLDATAMTTTGPIVSSDSVWSTSRASEVVQVLAREQVANPIIILDELDKLHNLSSHARPDATEIMLPLLEQRTAAAHVDHFLQSRVDLSFINWILLCNDLNRIAKPVRDRCIVIRMAAPSVDEIADIARREVARRGLAPELIPPLVRAVRSGRLSSLRKLHKALDAAAAAAARPLLN